MILEFEHLGRSGEVAVEVIASTDPASLGGDAGNAGFPACTATVNYQGGGYLAMMGWVQLVRSTDAESSAFEIDPFGPFADVDSPYAFYGYRPTLFDGPWRSHREDTDWVAHSFLATTPLDGGRQVRPLVGFSWGFTIRQAQVEVVAPAPLTSGDWAGHLPYLSATYPTWQFAPAFARD